jgi:hypothetical protein
MRCERLEALQRRGLRGIASIIGRRVQPARLMRGQSAMNERRGHIAHFLLSPWTMSMQALRPFKRTTKASVSMERRHIF